MPILDSNLVEALITAAATLLTGIIGVRFGTDYAKRNGTAKLHYDQLLDLYEPLTAIAMETDGTLSEEQVRAVSRLITQHNSLAAPALINAWKDLKADRTKNSKHFLEVLSSNYNWVKKNLGYPYEPLKIKLAYLPNRNFSRYPIIMGIFAIAIIVAGIFFMQLKSDLAYRIVAYVACLLGYFFAVLSITQISKEIGKL